MPIEAARLSVVVTAETSSAEAGLRRVSGEVKKTAATTSTAVDDVATSTGRLGVLAKDGFGKISALSTLGATGIALFAKQAITAASDLQESISKTRQIFKGASEEMISWSRNAASTMGLSQRAALDVAGSFAVLGSAAGMAEGQVDDFARQFSQLAADLASFYNTSTEDAAQAISAAFRGEAEPIRRYGVLLDEATLKQEALRLGIIQTTSQALTPQQRVLAAQAAIWKQTTVAQGDFARTSDGFANSMRTFKANLEDLTAQLGTAVLPALTGLLGVLNDLLALPPVRIAIEVIQTGTTALFNPRDNAIEARYGVPSWVPGFGMDPNLLPPTSENVRKYQYPTDMSPEDFAAMLAAQPKMERPNPFGVDIGISPEQIAQDRAEQQKALADTTRMYQEFYRGIAGEAAWAAGAVDREVTSMVGDIARLRGEFTGQIDADAAFKSMVDSIAGLGEVLKDPKASLLDVREALNLAKSDTENYASVTADLQVGMMGITDANQKAVLQSSLYRSELQKVANSLKPGDPLRTELQAYIDQLNAIPTNISTLLTLQTAIDKLDGIGVNDIKGLGPKQAFDAGGVVQGPWGSPQVILAHAGETILPTHKTPMSAFVPAGSGGLTTIHMASGAITVVSSDPRTAGDSVVNALREYERHNGTTWRDS